MNEEIARRKDAETGRSEIFHTSRQTSKPVENHPDQLSLEDFGLKFES